ncbi:tetratricopeptide repeat protein [Longispora albida]|uniref:tetratricopeptide repeat protein n=1 Tax=Longispora albida TaxID=203523 RepID=UPI00035E6316|nr:tetratricopeptide repeat protein [Longispora albida]
MTESYRMEVAPGGGGAAGPGSMAFVTNYYGTSVPPFEFAPLTGSGDLDETGLELLRDQPSQLLDSRRQVVGFAGRLKELGSLTRWRDAGPAVAARLVHGPGGQGKTRMITHFAELCAAAGWTVWQARSGWQGGSRSAVDLIPGEAPGLLIVVDYAERWSLDVLAMMAGDPRVAAAKRVRLLLAARSAGLWWGALQDRIRQRSGVPVLTDAVPLPPLAESDEDRLAVFEAARSRFAEIYECPDATVLPFPGTVGNEAYGSVLTLHMAALVSVDAHARGDVQPDDPAVLSRHLLQRELAHWDRMYRKKKEEGEPATPPDVMAQTVFVATLTRALPPPEAAGVLIRLGLAENLARAKEILGDHHTCYPSPTGHWLEPLYPDRLGEDFVALRLPGHTVGGVDADPWSIVLVEQLLAEEDGELPGYARDVVTILLETAHRWPHVRSRAAAMLGSKAEVAVSAGSTALLRLAELPGVETSVLEAIEKRLPNDRHIDLDLGIAAICEELTARRVADAERPLQVLLLAGLAVRLQSAGWLRRALNTAAESVRIGRALSAEDGDWLPVLALALSVQSNILLAIPRGADALPVTIEVARIVGELVESGAQAPAIFEPLQGGLTVGQAGDLYLKWHVGGRTTTYHLFYAAALGNQGNALLILGRLAEAEKVLRLALEVCNELGEDTVAVPAASTRVKLSLVLASQGRMEEAAELGRQALGIYRQLAEQDFASSAPALAEVLHALGIVYLAQGELDAALALTEEAERLQRKLAAVNPHAHEPLLASMLGMLSMQLAAAGRDPARAREVSELAARLSDTLNPAETGMGDPTLGMAQIAQALALSQEGRWEESARAAGYAYEVFTKLAKPYPVVYEPQAGLALVVQHDALCEMGRYDEAAGALRIAIRVMRPHTMSGFDYTSEAYLGALRQLAMILIELERNGEAIAAAEEAAGYLRTQAATDPAQELELAELLLELAALRFESGEDSAVLPVVRESLEIFDRRGTMVPSDAHAYLADMLEEIEGGAELFALLPSRLRPFKAKNKGTSPSEGVLRGKLIDKLQAKKSPPTR